MSAPKRLSGTALVTGAASGIGRATTLALAAAGIDTLILTDISESGLEETTSQVRSLSEKIAIRHIAGDISSPEFISILFSEDNITHLEYAVNCAGILGPSKPSAETSLEEFDKVNNVNYRGMWLCSREELKLMVKNEVTPYKSAFASSYQEAQLRGQRGSIVNIASQLALVGRSEAPAYCASKGAIMSLTRCDAIDYAQHRIRVNSVCPGVISTPLTTSPDGQISDRLKAAVDIAPMKRMGLPSEVADSVVWLLSGEASFVTGSGLVVDGGYIIN